MDYIVEHKAGTVFLEEGGPAGDMYLVKKGEALVFKESEAAEVPLAKVIEGELLGVMSALGAKKRTASVRATTDITLQIIPHDKMQELLSSTPQWVTTLLHDLTNRLNTTNNSYVKAIHEVRLSAKQGLNAFHATKHMCELFCFLHTNKLELTKESLYPLCPFRKDLVDLFVKLLKENQLFNTSEMPKVLTAMKDWAEQGATNPIPEEFLFMKAFFDNKDGSN